MVNRKSIYSQVLANAILALFIAALIYGVIFYSFQRWHRRVTYNKIISSINMLLSEIDNELAEAVFIRDKGSMRDILRGLLRSEGILSVSVYASDGELLFSQDNAIRQRPSDLQLRADAPSFLTGVQQAQTAFSYNKPIIKDEQVGFLKIYYAYNDTAGAGVAAVIFTIFLFVNLLLIAIVLRFSLRRCVVRPLNDLRERMHQLQPGEGKTECKLDMDSEISQLADIFNKLLSENEKMQHELNNMDRNIRQRVEEQTSKLTEINRQLQQEVVERREMAEEREILIKELERNQQLLKKQNEELENSRTVMKRMVEDLERSKVSLEKQKGYLERANKELEEQKRELEDSRRAIKNVVADLDRSNQALEEQKRVLEDANRELDDFTYIVSHDLKEPLRSIDAFSKFLHDDYKDKLDEDGRDYLGRIRSNAGRMQSLIEDLLEISRIERRRNPFKEVDSMSLVNEVRLRLEYAIKEKNVRLVVKDKLPRIYCDPIRLTEVFVNLVSNAIKFNDKPEPYVEIGCRQKDAFYEFYVKDNGPGIEEQYFDRIFEIFQRLVKREEHEGTGAGLTIVKKIVQMHGGKVWVESKVGEGATFYFTIPCREELSLKKKRLGEILIEKNLVSEDDIKKALYEQGRRR